MKKQELCQYLKEKLKNQFNELTIINICNYLWVAIIKINHVFDLEMVQLMKNLLFLSWMKQLEKGVPIQYVLNNSCFFGLDLYVDNNVLIPRPETEELVSWILEQGDKSTNKQLLDIGTGSGCIAIAVKSKRQNWKIDAIDISNEAIQIAKSNANKFEFEINFMIIDFLKDKSILNATYDLIVSNPPYISLFEMDQISRSVLLTEPQIALFPPGEDPLIFYKEAAIWAKHHLNKEGAMYFELNEFLCHEIQDIFKINDYSRIELREDLQGKKRMLKVQF